MNGPQVIADDNDQQAMLPKSPQSIQVGKFRVNN